MPLNLFSHFVGGSLESRIPARLPVPGAESDDVAALQLLPGREEGSREQSDEFIRRVSGWISHGR